MEEAVRNLERHNGVVNVLSLVMRIYEIFQLSGYLLIIHIDVVTAETQP